MPFYKLYKWGAENMALTDEEYTNKKGLTCPNCYKTEGVDVWGGIHVEGDIAWQEVSCSICNADWMDEYKLSGYSNLVVDST